MMEAANRLRKYVAGQDNGDAHYGEWGILRQDQRRYLRKCADLIDSMDDVIQSQFKIIDALRAEINALNSTAPLD